MGNYGGRGEAGKVVLGVAMPWKRAGPGAALRHQEAPGARASFSSSPPGGKQWWNEWGHVSMQPEVEGRPAIPLKKR